MLLNMKLIVIIKAWIKLVFVLMNGVIGVIALIPI